MLMFEPIRPPRARGCVLLRHTVSVVVPGFCTQNWLFSANTLARLPSPRSSKRHVSCVWTGISMHVASVNTPRKLSAATVGAVSLVAYENRVASIDNTPLSVRCRPLRESELRSW